MLALPLAAGLLLFPEAGRVSEKAVLVACCVATLAVAHLLYPLRYSFAPRTRLRGLAWPLYIGLVAGAAMALQVPQAAGLAVVARLAVGVVVLMFFIDGLTSSLAALPGGARSAPLIVLAVLALSTTTPVWLGPWAEHLAPGSRFADAVVRVSPLSYLAVMADYDYLRSQWFYRHSPLGALRYSYPGPWSFSAAYLLLAVLFRIREWRGTVQNGRLTNLRDAATPEHPPPG